MLKQVLIISAVIFGFIHLKAESCFRSNSFGQKCTTDTFGIRISIKQFDSLTQYLLVKFHSDSSLKSMEDYLQIVRVGNTIVFDQMEDNNKSYNELYYLYGRKYMPTIAKVLDAEISIGLSFYSKKYDLLIGGRKTKNNFYRIVN
jgi:hypothetical protein